MRWYKYSLVLTLGLLIELVIAIFSCILVKQNGEWLASLTLPYFAPKSPFFYGLLGECIYLSSAISLGFYVKKRGDLTKGSLLIIAEGVMQVLSLLFFFEFTYEITSFFLATVTMLLSVCLSSHFLERSTAAGISRLPLLACIVYFWMVTYCILMINFA